MKKFSVLSLLLFNVAFAQPEIILSPVGHIYTPEGFDSNDSVEVVVTGNFPNPCYGRNKVEVRVEDDVIDIEVTAILSERFRRICPEMMIPFKEVISLGNLQGGEYFVNVNKGAVKGVLNVAEAPSNAVDEHLYAAIDYVEKKGKEDYVLHGWKYSDCVHLDKVEVVSNNRDTLSILPIMKQTQEFCPMKGMPISIPVKLNFASLKTRLPLIHVRTMDGKSFNSIINIE